MKNTHLSVLSGVVAIFAFSMVALQSTEAAASAGQQQNKANATSSKQPQTTGEYIDDSLITAAVKANILEEEGLSSLQIKVKTKDGVVTLSGKIDTAEHVKLAERVAAQTNGVKKVVNRLMVDAKKQQSVGEYIDDAAITTSVKANILEEKGLSSLRISVKTKDGVVTLSGKTDTTEHAKLAERVAIQTNGVKRVVNNMRIGK